MFVWHLHMLCSPRRIHSPSSFIHLRNLRLKQSSQRAVSTWSTSSTTDELQVNMNLRKRAIYLVRHHKGVHVDYLLMRLQSCPCMLKGTRSMHSLWRSLVITCSLNGASYELMKLNSYHLEINKYNLPWVRMSGSLTPFQLKIMIPLPPHKSHLSVLYELSLINCICSPHQYQVVLPFWCRHRILRGEYRRALVHPPRSPCVVVCRAGKLWTEPTSNQYQRPQRGVSISTWTMGGSVTNIARTYTGLL